MTEFRWLYVDMNSYFASCEQQENPALRGRPVAVSPVMADSGCCIAASYPAKKCGIKTGTRVAEARKLCPEIEIVPARMPLYVDYHHKVLAAVESVTVVTGVRSIDELAVRLDPSERSAGAAAGVARRIKAAIRERAGEALTCSIGVAANEFLAKMAADLKKPDGFTALPPFPADEPPPALLALKLQDFPGVSRRMEARLNARGIESVAEMYAASRETLHAVWGGVLGDRWFDLIRGGEVSRPETRRRTVGHSHVMPPALRNVAGTRAVLLRLLQKAAARLRALGFRAGALGVYVKGSRSWEAAARFDPVSDPLTLAEEFAKLWAARAFSGPVACGVVLHELTAERDVTPSLFAPPNRRAALGGALDLINEKFGKNAVYLAAADAARETAEEKIAFTKTELFREGGAGPSASLRERAAERRARRRARVTGVTPAPSARPRNRG